MSLSEPFVKPSTMLYRNFLAMETEELIRSHPVDGAVLMGGCDKTTPGLLMGAISDDLPAIFMPAGPMLRGDWHGQTLGSGSDVWKYWDEKRAGRISEEDWSEMEERHRPLARRLHDDGHRRDHDRAHRSARADAARRLLDPGAPTPTIRAWRRRRPPHRRNGVGGPDARRHPQRRLLRQRRPRAHGARRLDQRHHPSHRHGAPGRRRARHGAFRRDRAAHAGHRQHHGRPANT